MDSYDSSSFKNCFNEVIKAWFEGKDRRPFINYAINKIEKNWDNDNVFIIEAPTGYGKSTISATIAMYSFREELKSIVTFPLRTLLEDQFIKFKELFGDELGKRYMHNPESRYLIKPVTLTTVDTLALTLFGIPPEDLDKVVKYWSGTSSGSLGHYLFSWASIALSNIIFDEVHLIADSTKSLNFLFALMWAAMDNDQKLVLMSATIPKTLEEKLQEFLEDWGWCNYEFIKFSFEHDKEFFANRRNKRYTIYLEALNEENKFRIIEKWIDEESKRYSKIIVVFNTIRDAVQFYELIKNKFMEFDKLLLHSRFNEADRDRKAEKLRRLKRAEKFIIVATQVIEAGVDISSNLFITELAPANSLIQRLGRFLRYDGENEGAVYIWYETDNSGDLLSYNGRYKVYDWDLTKRTLDKLMEMGEFNVHLVEGYKALLDVYTADDFQIEEKGLDDLKRILMNFEYAPLKAVETFFKLEGSFVRDGLMIPAISLDLLDECRKENGEFSLSDLLKLTVPVSFEVVKRANPEKVVLLRKDYESGDEIPEIVDFESLSNCTLRYPRSFLRCMIKNSIVAVVVDGDYDRERGLSIKRD